MATIYYTGGATANAQQITAQITGFDATTTYKLTIGAGSRTHVISALGVTDADATATALKDAWEASTHPYTTNYTATVATDTVTITADAGNKGNDITVVSSVTGGAGTIGAVATVVAAGGPHHWSDADNWSGAAIPASTDDVVIENSSTNILYGLDQNAVLLASLAIRQSYTGRLGLLDASVATAANGQTLGTALEYREDYLLIAADRIDIGESIGPVRLGGSGRIKISNQASSGSQLTVHDTASTGADTGLASVRYLVTDSNADVDVRLAPGGVAVAGEVPGETSTVDTLSVSDSSTGARVRVGSGVTMTTYRQQGGRNTISAAATVAEVSSYAGTLAIEGDFTVTAMYAYGGTITDNHIKSAADAVTDLYLRGGVVDYRASNEARTLAEVHLRSGTLRRNAALTVTAWTLDAELKDIVVR